MEKDKNLIMQEPTFYILLSLAQEEKHGYAIIKDVAELSSGKVQLSTGTLYGALSRLLDQGYVVQLEPTEQRGNPQRENAARPDLKLYPGKPRKTYSLTRLGRQALDGEARRLSSLVLAARLRLGENEA